MKKYFIPKYISELSLEDLWENDPTYIAYVISNCKERNKELYSASVKFLKNILLTSNKDELSDEKRLIYDKYIKHKTYENDKDIKKLINEQNKLKITYIDKRYIKIFKKLENKKHNLFDLYIALNSIKYYYKYKLRHKVTLPVLYKIKNIINGKYYIGMSIRPIKRLLSHCAHSSNYELNNDLKLYGLTQFEFSFIILEDITNVFDLNKIEIENIIKYKDKDDLYNVSTETNNQYIDHNIQII